MCVDYKRINAVTVKDKYPLPLMADMKTKFRDARYFTILDLRNAFNLIRIKLKNEWKTAFRTKYGTYEYLFMLFGLTINKFPNNNAKSGQQGIAIIFGQIRNNIHG